MKSAVIACAAIVLGVASRAGGAQVSSAAVTCAAVVTQQATSGVGGAVDYWNLVYAAGEYCVPEWADSLRSPVGGRATLARTALVLMGGRAAVDALRAEYLRAPNEKIRYALIEAMGSTGSPEDIAFLETQLSGPAMGLSGSWPRIQEALNTLGLLRATAARDSIQAVLGRSSQSSFVGVAAAAALAALDRQPCEGATTVDVAKTLVMIVMHCQPQAMSTDRRYRDRAGTGTWVFTNTAWSAEPSTPADSAVPVVATDVRVAGDGRHAEVTLSTYCGRLCGQGWTYRLLRTGDTWRIVDATMRWVS